MSAVSEIALLVVEARLRLTVAQGCVQHIARWYTEPTIRASLRLVPHTMHEILPYGQVE